MPIFLLSFLFMIKECRLTSALFDQCPDHIAGEPNAAFSTSAGCIYADNGGSSSTFKQALDRCQSE